MQVSGSIESGAIEVVSLDDASHAVLRLKPDINPSFRQWFHFRLVSKAGRKVSVDILEAGEYDNMKQKEGLAGHPTLWSGYSAFASYDRQNWFNVPTVFDGSKLTFSLDLEADAIYLATYVPYTLHRHRDVLGRWLLKPNTSLEVIARTPDGNDLDLMRIGASGAGRKSAWILARQHPGETQGSWCMEALIDRLLDPADPVSAELLDRAVFYVVPNMNPDGTARGHTRTNAQGVNLNREWDRATRETSPEIFHVLEKMAAYGIDFLLDLHAWGGDKPFCIGPWHVPTHRPDQERAWRGYLDTLAENTAAFEVGQPYPGGGPAPGHADISMSWNYVGERFGATAMLYELIYKPNAAEGATTSWSVEDCMKFGRASLEPMLQALTAA